ncbi:hypothetical protein [Janibacter indicus]|uniref:hypothetical protein n=1 Tax=Janibacter indicus TaxID=857417 RepID=UPI003D9A20A2
MTTTQRLHARLIKRDLDAESQLPDDVQRNVPGNTLRLVGANALQSSGDQMVNASTVLPWLFHAIGVPAALTGALVPIRESGSMLPQAFLTPLVIKVRQRKLVTLAGALVQAVAVAVMAVTAAIGSGLAAGLTIIVALAVFSLGRCLTSIASKDVQARTVPKGERGQINGLATTASGLVAITLGLAVRALGEGLDAQTLADPRHRVGAVGARGARVVERARAGGCPFETVAERPPQGPGEVAERPPQGPGRG